MLSLVDEMVVTSNDHLDATEHIASNWDVSVLHIKLYFHFSFIKRRPRDVK